MPGKIAPLPDADKSAATGNLVARCVQAAEGQVNAALLLMRILFWMPKATIERDGQKWIARSGADWAAEMHLSPHQYKRAAAWLRQHDLIVTEQHLFGGKNITFTRLTERGMTLLPKPGQAAPPGQRTSAPPGKRRTAPLYKHGETPTEEHQRGHCVPAHATDPGEDLPQDSGGRR